MTIKEQKETIEEIRALVIKYKKTERARKALLKEFFEKEKKAKENFDSFYNNYKQYFFHAGKMDKKGKPKLQGIGELRLKDFLIFLQHYGEDEARWDLPKNPFASFLSLKEKKLMHSIHDQISKQPKKD